MTSFRLWQLEVSQRERAPWLTSSSAAAHSFPGFTGEKVPVKSGKNAGGTREIKAVGRHEWRMATAPLDRTADGSALPQPAGCDRASHTVYVTHWNDSSKTKDVAIASTCLFGDTYEASIVRKLKAEDAKKQPELGRVGEKVSAPSEYGNRPRAYHALRNAPPARSDRESDHPDGHNVQRELQRCRYIRHGLGQGALDSSSSSSFVSTRA